MLKRLALFVPFLFLSGSAAAQDRAADPDAYPDREFDAGVYLWGASLRGTLEAGSGATADVDASFKDILDDLNIAAMVAGAGRIGRFVGTFDGMWLGLEDETDTGTVDRGGIQIGPAHIDDDVHIAIADLKLGYRILEPATGAKQPVAIDLLAGGRYWYIHNELDLDFPVLPDQGFHSSTDWFDPLVGMRVIIGLTPRLQFSALADVGGWGAGSSSDHTYQVAGLLGVKLSEAWSLRLGYKLLNVEREHIDYQLRGPVIGTFYRF